MLSLLMTTVAMFGAQIDQNAQAVAAAPVTSSSGSAVAAAPAAPAAGKPTQYCIKGTVTGSRMVRKSCKTRAEWLREGFDPTEPS